MGPPVPIVSRRQLRLVVRMNEDKLGPDLSLSVDLKRASPIFCLFQRIAARRDSGKVVREQPISSCWGLVSRLANGDSFPRTTLSRHVADVAHDT